MGPAEHPLTRLGTLLAEASDAELRAIPLPQQRERLVRVATRRRQTRALGLRCVGVLLVAAMVALLFTRSRPLSFEVGAAGKGRVDDWISAQTSAVPLSFSDGTVLTLAPETRARVAETTRAGARLVLEKGRLSANVVHRDKTNWRLVAGPFEVQVTGTRFELGWSPDSEVFELTLSAGSVVVKGPGLGSGRTLRTGEVLKTSLQRPKPIPTSARTAKPEPAVEPEPLPSAPRFVPEATRNAPSEDAALESIRTLAGTRDYAAMLRIARAEGFASLCSRAGSAELMSLADAARFSGDSESAGNALRTLRKRFPSDTRAATAAFLLGRSAFEQSRDYPGAARWFSLYLEEQPGGPLAGEALGRLAECRELMGDHAGAQTAARRYLLSHPTGPLAARARLLAD